MTTTPNPTGRASVEQADIDAADVVYAGIIAYLNKNGITATTTAPTPADDSLVKLLARHRQQAHAAGVAEATAWHGIESAPKDGSYILIATPKHDAGMTIARFDSEWSDGGWWLLDDGKNFEIPLRGPAPTHWMPKPPPPALSPGEIA